MDFTEPAAGGSGVRGLEREREGERERERETEFFAGVGCLTKKDVQQHLLIT